MLDHGGEFAFGGGCYAGIIAGTALAAFEEADGLTAAFGGLSEAQPPAG